MRMTRGATLTLHLILVGGSALAQSTTRVSVDSNGVEANGFCELGPAPAISADGRFVAFVSQATNLVAGDTNASFDVFLRDLQNGTTERASLGAGGVQANGGSHQPALSYDGRIVAFESSATNLVAADTNGFDDVFVRDRLNGLTEIVSVSSGGLQGNSVSGFASISADGRFVAFVSFATNLVAGDTNGAWDVFVRDRQNGTTERVSVSTGGTQSNNASNRPSISPDGRFVAFASDASNLVASDFGGHRDVFLRDRLNGTTIRVSVSSAGVAGTLDSDAPALSTDARYVVFMSEAANLVAGDTNGSTDIFVRDGLSGTIERASVSATGAQADSYSWYPSISADGRFVAFRSDATNLVPGDTNADADVFVRDQQTGAIERASVDSSGGESDLGSISPVLSGDGRFAAFTSFATNLVPGDTNGFFDTFVRDRGAAPGQAFCFGDAGAGPCPCGNRGSSWRGCENSASTGGAWLAASGSASLASDTLVFSAGRLLPTASCILFQGTVTIAALNFGDGLRCAGGALKRLYLSNASGGSLSVPPQGAPSVSARSAALGDVLGAGATRYYQVYYRDPLLGFCASPPGNQWNVSSALAVGWTQ